MGTIAQDKSLGKIAHDALWNERHWGSGALIPFHQRDLGDQASFEVSAQAVKDAVLAHAVNQIKSAVMFNSNPAINEFACDLINRINPNGE